METIKYEDLRWTEGQTALYVTASNDDGFRTGDTCCPEVRLYLRVELFIVIH